MQSWILDQDFYTSASYLDRHRLNANIYENIHILSSLLDINDKLVNPKRNVKNHPASKLWAGYEYDLLCYIYYHIDEWYNRGYKSDINEKNYWILQKQIGLNPLSKQLVPIWITDELIETHRSVLIQKEIEKDELLKLKYNRMVDINPNYMKKEKEKNLIQQKNNYHYRNLFPNTPTNLSMRYDWRKD